MIAKVQRHRRAEAVLRDLYQPSQPRPHTIPHLVAAAQEPASLEPERRSGICDVRRLASWLTQPLASLPPGGPARTVWHCTIWTHPLDRTLSDRHWEQIATEIVDRVGLAPRDDTQAVRWIAARHGPDHVHIIATLARQDGTPPNPRSDIAAVRNVCHTAEDRYALRSTLLTGKRSPGQARSGNPPGRDFPQRLTNGGLQQGPDAQHARPPARPTGPRPGGPSDRPRTKTTDTTRRGR